jgi:hypothetical protein
LCPRRNSCNSGQKQTAFALRMHSAKTFTSTIVNMKIYHRHISSVRNITLMSCCSGVTITRNIHYWSDFEVVQSSQIFCRNAEEYCEHFCWRIGKQISFPHTRWHIQNINVCWLLSAISLLVAQKTIWFVVKLLDFISFLSDVELLVTFA